MSLPKPWPILIIALLLSASCAATGQKPNLTQVHQWSNRELTTLKSLSIYNARQKSDKSNRVVNNPQAIRLGKLIFSDPRFSKDGTIACATCHRPKKHFTDGLKTARGLEKTNRNTPTIVGTSNNTWFFHDGRSDSLWSQALGPLENELEHGGNRGQYAHILFDDDKLKNLYQQVFSPLPDISDTGKFPKNAGPVSDPVASKNWQGMNEQNRRLITEIFVNIGKTIAAYESQLQPAPSRFDNYVQAALKYDSLTVSTTLSNDEASGLRLFIGKANCFLCHNGPLFTDNSFHAVNTPPANDRDIDWGRYRGAQQVLKSEFNCRSQYNDSTDKSCPELSYIVTEKSETFASFKTPSLRNVTKTAPYMHAGQYQTLKTVIEHYNNPPKLNYRRSDLLDIELSEKEMQQLELFLHTLDSTIVD